jgi:ketosteroid isomerase-like protein
MTTDAMDDGIGAELAAIAARLDAALVAQDHAAAAECFAVDAVLGESGLADVRGREAIRRFLADADQRRAVTHHRMWRDDLLVAGDRAVEACRFDETKQRPGADPEHERGRAVIFWRRDADGAWRIERLVVSDLPAPMGEEQ